MRFELNNYQREYLGLDSILPTWRKVSLPGDSYREESILYFEDTILKRYIVSTENQYVEKQYNVKTRERNVLLPKTSRGKERKLTASTLESVMPIGVYVDITSYGDILIGNYSTQTTFYSSDWEREQTKEINSFQKIINDFIFSSPSTHLQQINEFKFALKKRQRFKEGDIFAFKVSRDEYAFGQILLDIAKLKKKNLLPEKHGLRYLMAMPVLVRLYQYISKSSTIDVNVLKNVPALPSDYMMDNLLLYGEYKVIGYLPLKENDMDYPISYGTELHTSDCVFLQWGLISKTLPKKVFNKFTVTENPLVSETSSSRIMSNPYGYYSSGFRTCYTGKNIKESIVDGGFNFAKINHYKTEFDLRNPKNRLIKDELFSQFGLDSSKGYAENYRMTKTLSTQIK
jgi:hypothetical protein